MAQRSHKIIVVFIVFMLPVFLPAQKPFQRAINMQRVTEISSYGDRVRVYRRTPLPGETMVLQPSTLGRPFLAGDSYTKDRTNEKFAGRSFRLVPKNYVQTLSFFCRKEFQLQKISSLPFRFRLGSLDYVNWMEQKPNAVKPGF